MPTGRTGARAVFLIIASAFICQAAFAADIPGARDYPLVERDEGSEIVAFDQQPLADYRLFVAKVAPPGDEPTAPPAEGVVPPPVPSTTLPIAGAVTRITYRAADGRGGLEAFEGFGERLSEAGFQTVFTCMDEDCGGAAFSEALGMDPALFPADEEELRYLAAKREAPDGDAYAALVVVEDDAGRPAIQLDIVEVEAIAERVTVLDADALARELATSGRVPVYGLYFDFNKATLRPDSEPQLSEMAQLMTQQPELQLLIVGHTNNRQSIELSLGLTKLRADAVVAALADLGIDRARMTAVGAGMSGPIATNRSADGRALNRRIELVER